MDPLRLLLDLSIFWTLPLGLVCLSWLGSKLGARAPLLLFFPFPVMVVHTGYYLHGGMVAASGASALTMGSVPMVFSWAIPYFHLSRRLDGRLSSRHEEVVISFAAATLMAAAVQTAYKPWWMSMTDRPIPQLVGVLAVLALSALLLRLPADERAPASAIPTPLSFAARIITMVMIVSAMTASLAFPSVVGAVVLLVVVTFPRMTFEMAVSAHLTNGVSSARQILAGLPVGVTTAVVWCSGITHLPRVLPDRWVLPVAFLLTAAWWGVLVVGYITTFGVYRKNNGLFESRPITAVNPTLAPS